LSARAVIIPGNLERAPPDALYLYCRLQREHFWRDQFVMPSTYGKRFGMGRRRSRALDKRLRAINGMSSTAPWRSSC
jgi:hypothetical protein